MDKTFDRTVGIGSSEIAAVLGVDPFATPLDIFLRKKGLEVKEAEAELGVRVKLPTFWGNHLERAILDAYAAHYPEDIVTYQPGPIVGPIVGSMAIFGSADAILASGTPQRGAEIKNTGLYMRDRWGETDTDEVPIHVAAQCHWLMIVYGFATWDVAALIGGSDFRKYRLHANPQLHAQIMERAAAWWHDHVVTGNTPPLKGEGGTEYLKRLYPIHDEAVKTVSGDAAVQFDALVVERKDLDAQKAEAEDAIVLVNNQIRQLIGDHAGLVSPSGNKATWKMTKSNGSDEKTQIADGRALVQKLRGLVGLMAKGLGEPDHGVSVFDVLDRAAAWLANEYKKPGYRRLLVKAAKGDDAE